MTDPAGTVELTENAIALTFRSSVADFDLDRAVTDLAQLRAVKQALTIWEGELTDWISDALGRNEIDVEGVGHVQVKRGNSRTEWDTDALIRLVIARGRDERQVDPETGEALESEGEAVGRALMAAARPSWRVTSLRDLGIDADEYCTKTPGKLSVVID